MSDPAIDKPGHPWPPAFSSAFVDEARAMLDDRPILVIVGPVGGSRNRLAAQVAELPDGPARTRHVARFGENDLRFFAVSQLFRDVRPDHDASVDSVAAAVRSGLGGEPAPQIVLANTDLCDPESVQVLVRLAEDGLIRLIVTVTPETTSVHARLLAGAAVIEIPPLDGTTISHLLRARFGVAPHPLLVELLLERSGGSYAVVQDLADTSIENGLISVVEGVLVLTPSSEDPLTGRLSSLLTPHTAQRLGGGEEITDLVHLTALLDQLDVDEAVLVVGRDVVDLATRHGGLKTVDGALVFTLRAEAVVVRRTMPLQRQIDLFDRFSAALPKTLARPGVAVLAADWWRATGHLLPVDVAARAAKEANLLGHYRRTIVYSEPSNNVDQAPVAAIERAFALAELGDHDDLVEVFSTLDPSLLSEDELLPFLRTLIVRDDVVAQDLIARAVSSPDPALQRRRESVRTLAELVVTGFSTGDEATATRLRSLAFSAQLSPGNRAATFAALAAVLRHSGRPAQAVDTAAFALKILVAEHNTVSAFHLDMTRENHIMALVSALDMDGAEEALNAYSSGVFASPGSGRMTTALHTYVALIRGDMSSALVSARLCLDALGPHDPHGVRGWVEAMLAAVLVYDGRVDEAEEQLAAAKGHVSAIPLTDLYRRIAIASVHDSLAEPEEALDILADVVVEARDRKLLVAEIDAAGASVLIGGPPHVRALLDVVDRLVEPAGSPQIWQTFARAVSAYDIDALVELADELQALGAGFYAAAFSQFVLDMARRASDLDPETRQRLAEAADLSMRSGV